MEPEKRFIPNAPYIHVFFFFLREFKLRGNIISPVSLAGENWSKNQSGS